MTRKTRGAHDNELPASTEETSTSETPTLLFQKTLTLADGREIIIKAPRAAEFSLYLRAMPAISKITEISKQSRAASSGVIGLPIPELTEAEQWLLNPLLARCTGLEPAEISELLLFDWMAIFNTVQSFGNRKNLTSPTPSTKR